MRVTVIRPPVLMPRYNMATLVVPPLGPAYVAAAIRQAGHDVSLIDAVGLAIEKYTPQKRGLLHGLTIEELVGVVSKDVDAIGVSVQFSFEWPLCRALLRMIRERFPRVLLFAGGEHVTALPQLSMEETDLDAVVLGEGEATVVDLLNHWASQGRDALAAVPGLCYRGEDGRLMSTSRRPRQTCLDAIPRPAWDLVPLEEYLCRHYGFGVDRGRSMPVLASRGCPYQCTFCSNSLMWTTKWLARDPNDLLDEMSELQARYRVQNFDFYDLTVIVNRQWIIDFCHAMERRNLSFTWQLPSGTRSESIDDEVARLLYRTGCRNVSFAPESGSPEILRSIKKQISLPRMIQSMRDSVAAGLNVKANVIFGFPRETLRHILESFAFIVKVALAGIHDLSIWVFVPYPGCEIFGELRAVGRIPALTDEYYDRLAAYAEVGSTFSYADRLSQRMLVFLRVVGVALFYVTAWIVRPWRAARFVWNSLFGKVMESRSEMALRSLLKRVWKTSAKSDAATRFSDSSLGESIHSSHVDHGR